MHLSSPKAVEPNGFGWTGVVSQSCSQTSSLVWEKHVEPFQLLGAVSVRRLLGPWHRRRVEDVTFKTPFSGSSTLVPDVSYFKSTGLREIEFPGKVKASLQLGNGAKLPQTSRAAPAWEICGDSEHFRPGRKMRATKIASFKTTQDKQKTGKK